MALNQVALVGNLTRDPERRAESVVSLRLAVNSRKKVGDEWTEAPGYYDVTCFGRLADLVEEHLSKGRQVAISGRLDWREWEDKDGNKRQAVGVIASDVQFIGPKADAAPSESGGSSDEAGSDDEPFFT